MPGTQGWGSDMPTDTFLADDGASIRLRIKGNGPPIVLLHEWAADFDVWRPIQDDLARDHTVYAWTARGHGGGATDGEPATVVRMARDLHQMINHYAMPSPLVIGHSMGALTVWQYVALFGCDRLGGLCLIDQSPRIVTDAGWRLGIYGDFSAERNQAFLDSLAGDFAETVLRLVAGGRNERARQLYQRNSTGMQRLRERLGRKAPAPLISIWRSLGEADFRPVLPRISVPTLLIYGTASNYYGTAVADHVHARIKGSVLKLYEDADHSPHLGQRERFLDDLGQWLADTLRNTISV